MTLAHLSIQMELLFLPRKSVGESQKWWIALKSEAPMTQVPPKDKFSKGGAVAGAVAMAKAKDEAGAGAVHEDEGLWTMMEYAVLTFRAYGVLFTVVASVECWLL